jgi:hypothetical protein
MNRETAMLREELSEATVRNTQVGASEMMTFRIEGI